MKDAAIKSPGKLTHGYPLPKVILAVGIAVAVHGAFLGATIFGASNKAPEAAANAKADAKKTDGTAPAATPSKENAPPVPDKATSDVPSTDAKAPDSEPRKVDKPAEPMDELKLDSK